MVGIGAARRMPSVPELLRAPYGARGTAPDPDFGLWRWMRLGGRVVERPVLPVEVAFAAPERAHQPDRLVGAAVTAVELDSHEVELVLVPTHPDTERETSAGELLKRRDLFRQVHRVVQRHEHDRGAETDPFRPAGDPTESDERVVDTTVGVDR